LSRRRTKHIHTNGCTQSCVAARARPRTLFDTACSPLADRRAGNMTLLGAERAHKNGRSCNFDRVLIVAAVYLSPILIFWIGGILSRFLRRRRQARVLSSGAVGVDRSGSIRGDKTADPN